MRNRPRVSRWLVIALAVVVSLNCQVQRAAESSQAETVIGTLYVTGNEPFTFLSLQTADGVMHPINKDSTTVYTDLWKLQGKKVELFCRPMLRKSAIPSLIVERYRVVD